MLFKQHCGKKQAKGLLINHYHHYHNIRAKGVVLSPVLGTDFPHSTKKLTHPLSAGVVLLVFIDIEI